MRIVRCKGYHESISARDEGSIRGPGCHKSRCPGWARDANLRGKLLDEALVDPDGGNDLHGRPRRLWNAVNGWFFVGVSTGEPEEAYNCYPEVPATRIRDELSSRSVRTVEEFLGIGGGTAI